MIQVQPMSQQALRSITTPQAVSGGQSQAYPFTLYDVGEVQNGDTQASFFTVPRTARFATNLPTPGSGQLPSETWFRVHSLHVTVLGAYDNAADPDIWSDVNALVGGVNQLGLEIQGKNYGPWPILEASALGGITGQSNPMADATATSQAFAANGIPGGRGIEIAGSLFLLPNASFGVELRYSSALSLAASRNVQVAMRGVIYRPVT